MMPGTPLMLTRSHSVDWTPGHILSFQTQVGHGAKCILIGFEPPSQSKQPVVELVVRCAQWLTGGLQSGWGRVRLLVCPLHYQSVRYRPPLYVCLHLCAYLRICTHLCVCVGEVYNEYQYCVHVCHSWGSFGQRTLLASVKDLNAWQIASWGVKVRVI